MRKFFERRFEDEDEDEDEDEALCFRYNEIFKLFRLRAEISGILVMVRCSSTTSRGTTYWFLILFFPVPGINLRMRKFFERRFEDEDEDEALCFRYNEIFKLFRLQLGRDDEFDCYNIVTPSLSRI